MLESLASDRAEIAAIVLAAGSSSRFGSDKLLHPVTLHGVTLPLAAHSLLPWVETFDHTTVVVRPGSGAFCRAIATSLCAMSQGAIGPDALHWLICTDAEEGMAASLACGVRANRSADGWMIGLADMPAVPLPAIEDVRTALRNGADLSAACRSGRRGHPVGFGSRYCEELQALQGDTGARYLLERDAPDLVQIQMSSDGIFADIDTPRDLQYL